MGLYLMLGLISSFLLDESRSHDDVDIFYAVRRNEKRSELAIFCLKKFGFVNSKADPSLIFYESRLSLPMDLLAADFEECPAMEEAADVLQVKGLARFRQFDLSYAILVEALNCSDDWASFVSFVNGKLKFSIGLAIVLDFMHRISISLQVADTSVGASLQIRFKKLPSPTSR
jgi:hypothetical protein